jgi:ketosteroid isomerase-like protein
MDRINRAWLGGMLHDLSPLVHPRIVMVLPGFAGRVQGRDAFLAGFQDFCSNATVHEFSEHDRQVDVAGETAVISIRYEMVYERGGARSRVMGRDLWVFERGRGGWVAVWRTMLDVQEESV